MATTTIESRKIERPNSAVLRDADLYNVVAVLPGTANRDRRILVTAHYDTIVRSGGAGTGGETPPLADPNQDQPGVNDDGSGIACVLELVRVLSQYKFEKTLVFVAFAGEEEGLLGSRLYSAKAKRENLAIEAVLNNDMAVKSPSADGPKTAGSRYSVKIPPIRLPGLWLVMSAKSGNDMCHPCG